MNGVLFAFMCIFVQNDWSGLFIFVRENWRNGCPIHSGEEKRFHVLESD